MAKTIPISEHYQHFLAELKESFWGHVYGETRLAWKRVLEADSRRRSRRQPYCNGCSVGGALTS
ncbi:MAG TPA: hypothetical protein VNX26_06150 [Candidatus Acidoferrum sp.]|nr:hypothetical protein [Candidatus Acidoferrum sp.]